MSCPSFNNFLWVANAIKLTFNQTGGGGGLLFCLSKVNACSDCFHMLWCNKTLSYLRCIFLHSPWWHTSMMLLGSTGPSASSNRSGTNQFPVHNIKKDRNIFTRLVQHCLVSISLYCGYQKNGEQWESEYWAWEWKVTNNVNLYDLQKAVFWARPSHQAYTDFLNNMPCYSVVFSHASDDWHQIDYSIAMWFWFITYRAQCLRRCICYQLQDYHAILIHNGIALKNNKHKIHVNVVKQSNYCKRF